MPVGTKTIYPTEDIRRTIVAMQHIEADLEKLAEKDEDSVPFALLNEIRGFIERETAKLTE